MEFKSDEDTSPPVMFIKSISSNFFNFYPSFSIVHLIGLVYPSIKPITNTTKDPIPIAIPKLNPPPVIFDNSFSFTSSTVFPL